MAAMRSSRSPCSPVAASVHLPAAPLPTSRSGEPDIEAATGRVVDIADDPVVALLVPVREVLATDRLGLAPEPSRDLRCGIVHVGLLSDTQKKGPAASDRPQGRGSLGEVSPSVGGRPVEWRRRCQQQVNHHPVGAIGPSTTRRRSPVLCAITRRLRAERLFFESSFVGQMLVIAIIDDLELRLVGLFDQRRRAQRLRAASRCPPAAPPRPRPCRAS